jgi:PD-(D/E)XK nuclease superfamily
MTATTPYPKALRLYPEIRHSILGAFDLCALETHFDLTYRKGWSSHPQARGTIFHRFAGRALTEMNRQNEQTIEVDVALAILQEVLLQEDVDRVCPECGTTKIRKGLVGGGYRLCENRHRFETEFVNVPWAEVKDLVWTVKKWATDNAFDIANLVDVEHRLKATVAYPNPEGGEVERILTGQLDSFFVEGEWDDHGIVLDWKDMWKLPRPTEVSFEGYFQQKFYAWLIFKQKDEVHSGRQSGIPSYESIERVTLREFYVRRSEPREATIWRSQVDEIEHELAALVNRFDRAVEENLWVPTPGTHCSYCPRPTACPIPPFARGAGKIQDQREADRAARQLIVAEAIVKQNKEALASWAAVHGNIPIRDAKGERVWGHRETVRVERPDRDKLADALSRGEVNLDRLYPERTITKFEPHVPEPKDEAAEAAEDAKLMAALQESVAEANARHVA